MVVLRRDDSGASSVKLRRDSAVAWSIVARLVFRTDAVNCHIAFKLGDHLQFVFGQTDRTLVIVVASDVEPNGLCTCRSQFGKKRKRKPVNVGDLGLLLLGDVKVG
jgi:hypothetical protein